MIGVPASQVKSEGETRAAFLSTPETDIDAAKPTKRMGAERIGFVSSGLLLWLPISGFRTPVRLDSGRAPATLSTIMKRILVIDDDLSCRLLLTKLLESEGYEVASADAAEAGLEAAWSQRPDLVITDFDMPVYNGLKAIRMLHCDSNLQVPVIIVSGVTDESVLEHGADAFFRKPVNGEQLLAKVAELLSAAALVGGLPG